MKFTIDTFAARIKEQGCVWSLKAADDTWVMHEDPEDGSEAMPVWADADSAARCAVGEWADFEPTQVDLDNFVNDFLPALDEEAAWVGINFDADNQGDLVDPQELAALIGAEL